MPRRTTQCMGWLYDARTSRRLRRPARRGAPRWPPVSSYDGNAAAVVRVSPAILLPGRRSPPRTPRRNARGAHPDWSMASERGDGGMDGRHCVSGIAACAVGYSKPNSLDALLDASGPGAGFAAVALIA